MNSDNFKPVRGRARGYPYNYNNPLEQPMQSGSSTQHQPRQCSQRPTIADDLKPSSNKNHQLPKYPLRQESVDQLIQQTQSLTTDECETVPNEHGEMIDNREKSHRAYFQPPRPQFSLGVNGKQGTSGVPIHLLANYFPITSHTNWCLYQYRVDFNPEEDRIGTKRGLLSQHQERLGGYLFDGTMLFSGTRYNPEKFELTSQHRSNNQMVIITVKFTNIIETGDYANIQVFNLLLRNCLRHLKLKLIGRNFYDPIAKINIAKHRIELWPGYETTIGMYENNILLCADISTKVLRQETILDYFYECATRQYRSPDWMNHFKRNIIGTIVMTIYNNETYKIDDIDENSNPLSNFDKKDGSKISYIQYYKERWNLNIQESKQPMLISKNKKSVRRYGNGILVYLIPEFCIMTGISDAMRNNFALMKDMAIYTNVNPEDRTRNLFNFAKRLKKSEECMAELKKWNLTLSENLVDVSGRIFPSEQIHYSNNGVYNGGSDADWTRHLRDLPMFTCTLPSIWTVLFPRESCNEVKSFICNLIKVAKQMSFILPQPMIIPLVDGNTNTFIFNLEKVINERNPTFIVCVIQSARGDLYSIIKRKLCVNRAIPSQVVLLKNVKKNILSVCTKIVIQINCKLGGAPWLVTIPKKGMMIVGFDVSHDIQRKNSSYGALVATMNDEHTSYFSCVEAHKSGEELSNYIRMSISKALVKYTSRNGILPTSIIVYRDGVGDGQISQIHSTEVKQLKCAFKQFYGEDSVPLTFIIVSKRITTRFFALYRGCAQNPPPGTIVDSVVTDPTKYDFFLVSQHVRHGTVTPTHYQIIEDTLNLQPDRIQQLTYKLTHMYYNWTGTIRVPAPCQLAHKLAFFTAQTLRTSPNVGLEELLYFL